MTWSLTTWSYTSFLNQVELETIVIYCDTNDLKTKKDHIKIADYVKILGLLHQCKVYSNNVMVSGIVAQNDNLNDNAIKVNKNRKYNKITNPRYNCNQSKLHFGKRGTNLLIENTLFSLSSEISDWHKCTVSKFQIYTKTESTFISVEW